MLDANKLEGFFSVLKQYQATRDEQELSWTIKPFTNELKQELEGKGVKCAAEGSELVIELKNQEFSPDVTYFTEKNFLQLFRFPAMAKTTAIIADDYSFIIRDSAAAIQKSAMASADLALLSENTFAYYKLYENFKSDKFSQHHNESQKDIVVYSSSRGVFRISYKGENPRFTESITQKVDDLLVYALMPHYKPHIIHAIIDCSRSKVECHLKDVIDNSNLILENAIQGYNMAISQFDFDKVRNALYKEKEKFFANIRDITSKLFTQIIAIPITASATAFASYKVDGNVSLNVAILSGFILFTILYVIAQLSYYDDLSMLKKDFDRDFNYIEKYSGINEVEIKSERTKLQSKIGSSKVFICFSIFTFVAINIMVSRYVLIQIMKAYLPPYISCHL